MRYDNLRKTARDRGIRRFAKNHPKWSHREIGNFYGLSSSNITRILKHVTKDMQVPNDCGCKYCKRKRRKSKIMEASL